ncbi:ATPase [Fusobacterium necrophorum]|uniref:ATPase n=1 Tax=Fusobacterium necrophorum TaxID=859 RepID=A0A4Q2KT92_9FUSO|nr:ATP synthase subunit I [Fusobacterium necrophorum]RXZ68724.1 ATPase [Fusobacterium necrophorum]
MEDIKTIFKHAGIFSALVLVYGILIWNPYVVFGTFSGSLVAILNFYSLCEDVKTQVFQKDDSRRRTFLRYVKRYVFCGIYLAFLAHFWGLAMMLSAAVGLLNIKLNIYLLPVFKKLKNYSRKEE